MSDADFPIDLPPMPPRREDSHKGEMGRVLIVGGSAGLIGAVLLAARAALRSGAGLVTAAIPGSERTAFDAACWEAMSRPLPEDDEGCLVAGAFERLVPLLDAADALVLGPGLGRSPATEALFARVLDRYKGPHVIDADGLWHLARDRARLERGGRRRILTPHDAEFDRLRTALGLRRLGRRDEACEFAERIPGVLLRKGPGTLIATADRTVVNRTGNPGLATGGTGDVLSGIIGALLGRGDPPEIAARRGAWLHGRAGDRARDRLGMESMIASDVIEELPGAIREMEGAVDARER